MPLGLPPIISQPPFHTQTGNLAHGGNLPLHPHTIFPPPQPNSPLSSLFLPSRTPLLVSLSCFTHCQPQPSLVSILAPPSSICPLRPLFHSHTHARSAHPGDHPHGLPGVAQPAHSPAMLPSVTNHAAPPAHAPAFSTPLHLGLVALVPQAHPPMPYLNYRGYRHLRSCRSIHLSPSRAQLHPIAGPPGSPLSNKFTGPTDNFAEVSYAPPGQLVQTLPRPPNAAPPNDNFVDTGTMDDNFHGRGRGGYQGVYHDRGRGRRPVGQTPRPPINHCHMMTSTFVFDTRTLVILMTIITKMHLMKDLHPLHFPQTLRS